MRLGHLCLRSSARFFGLAISLFGLCGVVDAQDIDFQRDVRPILADKCYACHGPDEAQRQADLRLDDLSTAIAKSSGAAAIVPGAPEKSWLVERIQTDDSDLQMPPVDHHKQLTATEKKTLVSWIRQGAVWQQHWAYLPPKRPEIPALEERYSPSARNAIDRFVFNRLEREGFTPSEAANPATLIRRLSFDLLGLPPTPEQVQQFVHAPSTGNYERLVDEFLSSPAYGERMAMVWLDLVRYADTVGYHGDQDVSISPYRDYVINAFNANKPFDTFTREQLAGDLLPSPTQEQLVASGYNKLGMMSAEGGVQPEEYLAKYIADRVRNASSVWLGSTLACAECHDHKYDPFTTRDFYQFAAFFADIKERGLYSGANTDGNWGPYVMVPDAQLEALLNPLAAELEELENVYRADSASLAKSQREWEQGITRALDAWQLVRPAEVRSQNGATLTVQENGDVLATGERPNTDTYHLTIDLPAGTRSLQIQVAPDAQLPASGPGRASNGNFVITEVTLSKATEESEVMFGHAWATHEQADGNQNPHGKWAAAAAIDDDKHGATWGWAILPQAGQTNALVLELAEPLPEDGSFELTLEQNHDNPGHTLGKFRVNATDLDLSTWKDQLPAADEAFQVALRVPDSQRTAEQAKLVQELHRRFAPELSDVRDRLSALKAQREDLLKRYRRSSLITESVEPREIRVLPRGNWMDKSGDVVSPAAPHFLAPIVSESRPTRLDLANWIVADDNPLTARVFVNRLWKMFFGTGLSKSLEDFGSTGEAPSHPELLDALAIEFVQSGWDIKHMVRLIVSSSTYQQSSLPRQELESKDPYNRLLARQSRFRLDAELIRDNALAASGLLVQRVGGRSVKPYQPPGLYRHLNFPTRVYSADEDANQFRRGVYTHWQRQFLHPALQAFDAPSREECTAQRSRSNTPLAALVMLNDPSQIEAARRLAEVALISEQETAEDRVSWLFQRVLSRRPDAEEVAVLTSLLASERALFEAAPQDADSFVNTGISPQLPGLESTELAAWTTVCRAVLNMHEAINRN